MATWTTHQTDEKKNSAMTQCFRLMLLTHSGGLSGSVTRIMMVPTKRAINVRANKIFPMAFGFFT